MREISNGIEKKLVKDNVDSKRDEYRQSGAKKSGGTPAANLLTIQSSYFSPAKLKKANSRSHHNVITVEKKRRGFRQELYLYIEKSGPSNTITIKKEIE